MWRLIFTLVTACTSCKLQAISVAGSKAQIDPALVGVSIGGKKQIQIQLRERYRV